VGAANVLNIALNYLFIGGHLGLPAMGARGSALSTTIVRCVLGVALVAYAWRWYRNEKLEPSETHGAERAASKRAQWRLGLSSSITVTAIAILTAPLTLVAGRLGIIPLASFSAAWNIAGPAVLVTLGLSDAAGIYVASEAAYGNLRATARVAWAAVRITFVPTTLSAIVLFVWAPACASLYTTDTQVRLSLASLLPLLGALLLVDSVGFVMSASLRALRDTVWPAGIQIAAMALLVPLTFHFAWYGGYGVRGLYIAMLISSVIRVSLLIWRFSNRTKPSPTQPDAPIENQWSLHAK
jgi:MATE family multidrug resistance protein